MSGKNLSFLSKKSWHTGTIKHMDKVWQAEQKHNEEQKKIQELQKELERERSRKELLDAKNGGAGKGKETLDWMYRGVLTATTTAEQELNKPYIAPDEKEDLTTPSLLQRKPVSATQDDWNKVMEDPLLNIRQQEQEAIKMIAKNPVKMKALMQKLEEQKFKKRKRSKSKSSSSHKKHKSRRSYSPSPSPPRKKRRSSPPRDREYAPTDKRREESSPRSHRRRDRSPDRRSSHYSSSRRSRSPSWRRRRHSRSPSPRMGITNERRPYSPDRRRYASPDRRRNRSPPRRDSDRSRSPRNSGGRRKYSRVRSRTAGMSEEERMARIKEMEEAGRANYEHKLQRYMRSKKELQKDEEELTSRNEDENFITEMKQDVYMDKDATIEERLSRHRHYLAREHDEAI